MPKALEEVTKEALDLPLHQRLALASFLLESTDTLSDPGAEAAWDSEIRDRIRAIDEGRVAGHRLRGRYERGRAPIGSREDPLR